MSLDLKESTKSEYLMASGRLTAFKNSSIAMFVWLDTNISYNIKRNVYEFVRLCVRPSQETLTNRLTYPHHIYLSRSIKFS